MRLTPFISIMIIACSIGASGCGQNEPTSPQQIPAKTNIEESETPHKVRLKSTTQEAEMIELRKKISRAGIGSFFIMGMEPGSVHKIHPRSKEKKLLVYNSAARKLYPAYSDANADGFLVWEFYPDSLAAQDLDRRFRKEGGYSDDTLYIWWEGLEFAVSE